MDENALFYVIETEEILITAVAHLHRDPKHYSDRIIWVSYSPSHMTTRRIQRVSAIDENAKSIDPDDVQWGIESIENLSTVLR